MPSLPAIRPWKGLTAGAQSALACRSRGNTSANSKCSFCWHYAGSRWGGRMFLGERRGGVGVEPAAMIAARSQAPCRAAWPNTQALSTWRGLASSPLPSPCLRKIASTETKRSMVHPEPVLRGRGQTTPPSEEPPLYARHKSEAAVAAWLPVYIGARVHIGTYRQAAHQFIKFMVLGAKDCI